MTWFWNFSRNTKMYKNRFKEQSILNRIFFQVFQELHSEISLKYLRIFSLVQISYFLTTWSILLIHLNNLRTFSNWDTFYSHLKWCISDVVLYYRHDWIFFKENICYYIEKYEKRNWIVFLLERKGSRYSIWIFNFLCGELWCSK